MDAGVQACGNGVVVADEKVMVGGRPGPGLLARIVVSKFQDSLPLYRQCQIYKRAGVSIAPSTLGDWLGDHREVHDLLRKLRFMVADPIHSNDDLRRFVALGLTPSMPLGQAA